MQHRIESTLSYATLRSVATPRIAWSRDSTQCYIVQSRDSALCYIARSRDSALCYCTWIWIRDPDSEFGCTQVIESGSTTLIF
jgi:hypothetical protein